METIVNVHNLQEANEFWKAYRACTEGNRVRPDRSPFYVKWAKEFANSLPEKSLENRSREDIEVPGVPGTVYLIICILLFGSRFFPPQKTAGQLLHPS
jgi:hypothetical protein